MKVDALSRLLDVILDDLSARFIINLPEEELSSVTRICFGLEQAHWFYEDFFRPLHPELPSVNLRAFTAALFSHCPLLWKFSGQHEAAFDDFLKYKIRVPVRGAIMLNQDMTKCVLVKGWKASAGWGFPKGKIDQDEDDADCAIREVREECGFDISSYVKEKDYIDMVMKEQSVRLYVLRGIPLDTEFEPQTRKEISKIDWFDLDTLPTYKKDASSEVKSNLRNNKFYMVAPFLAPLRKWIKRNKPRSKKAPDATIVPDNVTKPSEEVAEIQPVATVSDRSSTDASSQALKLLMGIVDAPQDAVKNEQSFKESCTSHNEAKHDSGYIDLASLFQKSTKQIPTVAHDTSIPNRHLHGSLTQSKAIPLNVLNTSIEASIMDQLLPSASPSGPFSQDLRSDARGQQAQYRQMPSNVPILSYPPPPWIPQEVRPPPVEPRFVPPISYLPEHSPFASPGHSFPHGSGSYIPMRSGLGPPGLQAGNPSQSPPRKANPNAPSLLALLKPPGQQGNSQAQQNLISLPPAHPDGSTRARMPMSQSRPDHDSASGNHKQSLLALLKPADSGIHSNQLPSAAVPGPFQQGRSQAVPHPPAFPGPAPTSSRDAFLLDYLTQAVKGIK